MSYFRLDETSATAANQIAGGPVGQFTNGVSFGTPGAIASDASTAVTFSDVQNLTVPSSSFPHGSESRSVEAWVKVPVGVTRATFLSYDGIQLFWTNVFGYPNNYQVSGPNFRLGFDNTDVVGLGDGAWHQIAYTWDQRSHLLRLYEDGVVVAQTTTATVASGDPQPMTTGFAGSIDEVAVYAAALAPEQLSAHWTRGQSSSAPCPNPATGEYATSVIGDGATAYYGFTNSATAQRVAYDASSTCANGALATGATPDSDAVANDTDGSVRGSGTFSTFRANSTQLPHGTASRSVEAWIKIPPGVTAAEILSYDGIQLFWTNRFGYPNNYQVSGPTFRLGFDNTDVIGLGDGGWHQVAYTWDEYSHTLRLYEDGIVVAETTTATVASGDPAPLTTGFAGSVDEVAVYPAALTSNQITAHWLAGRAVTGPAIQGSVSNQGLPLAGSTVQACDGSGRCVSTTSGAAGRFRFDVSPGIWALHSFPPTGYAGGGHGGDAQVTVTAPSGVTVANLPFVYTALPAGAALDSPTFGHTVGSSPVVNWSEATHFTTDGCPGGIGALVVVGPDGLADLSVSLTETPASSGHYSADIPPLAPIHGSATMQYSILCRVANGSSFLPAGGPGNGGATVFLHIESSAPIDRISFGAAAGTDLKPLTSGLYQIATPAGAGQVPVTVHFSNGTSRSVGTYSYLGATISDSSGSSSGGDLLIVNGSGFTPNTQVLVGPTLAEHVTVQSPTKLSVQVPSGSGTQPVFLADSNGGFSVAGTHTYSGTPTVGDTESNKRDVADGVKTVLQTYYSGFINGKPLYGAHYRADYFSAFKSAGTGLIVDEFTNSLGLSKNQRFALETLNTYGNVADFVGATRLGQSFQFKCCNAYIVLTAIAMWEFNHGGFLPDNRAAGFRCLAKDFWGCISDGFDTLIDPSGTVVDRNGVPVTDGTATILRRNDQGAYVPMVPGSPSFEPSINP